MVVEHSLRLHSCGGGHKVSVDPRQIDTLPFHPTTFVCVSEELVQEVHPCLRPSIALQAASRITDLELTFHDANADRLVFRKAQCLMGDVLLSKNNN